MSDSVTLIIKLISKVRKLGSDPQTATNRADLSKQAQKFNFLNNKKVVDAAKGTNPSATAKGTQPKNTTVYELKKVFENEDQAILYADYVFNRLAGIDNSQKYSERRAQFDTMKAKTLNDLGVSDWDQLTQDQRRVYAQTMLSLNAPFKYTQQSVHIKFDKDDARTVCSKSHRVLGSAPLTPESFAKYEPEDVKKLSAKWKVQTRTVTVDSTTEQNESQTSSRTTTSEASTDETSLFH